MPPSARYADKTFVENKSNKIQKIVEIAKKEEELIGFGCGAKMFRSLQLAATKEAIRAETQDETRKAKIKRKSFKVTRAPVRGRKL